MARVNQPCLRVRLALGVVELQASCFTQKLEHYAWNLNESRPQTNHASDIQYLVSHGESVSLP